MTEPSVADTQQFFEGNDWTAVKRWFLFPPVLSALGVAWIAAAVSHYERATGRGLYGLAGYWQTVPSYVFHAAAGGDEIERWAVGIPVSAILTLLVLAGVVFTVLNRRRGIAALLIWWVSALASGFLFAAAAGWVHWQIMGEFV